MRTGLPAALLRGTPSAIRDDRFTRCPFPAATTHAPVALARSSNNATEPPNRCTDLRHPELLATSLLKCPRQDCCETPSETKKIGKLSPLSSFIFLTLRGQSGHAVCASNTFAVGTRVTSRPPHRSVRAQFGHTACMGLSLSRGRHAILVVLCIPFFCSTRAASILPSRPHISIAVARSDSQGRRFFSAAEGLSLTDASTAAGCRRSGGWPRDDPRGACHWPRSIARTTLVFG